MCWACLQVGVEHKEDQSEHTFQPHMGDMSRQHLGPEDQYLCFHSKIPMPVVVSKQANIIARNDLKQAVESLMGIK